MSQHGRTLQRLTDRNRWLTSLHSTINQSMRSGTRYLARATHRTRMPTTGFKMYLCSYLLRTMRYLSTRAWSHNKTDPFRTGASSSSTDRTSAESKPGGRGRCVRDAAADPIPPSAATRSGTCSTECAQLRYICSW
jgi:hypothetical protein